MKRALASLALCTFASAAAAQSGNNLEIISPAIKVNSGKIHPHKWEQILQYLTSDVEALHGITQTLKAANASPKLLELGQPEQLIEIHP
jgi:hypothetical protein